MKLIARSHDGDEPTGRMTGIFEPEGEENVSETDLIWRAMILRGATTATSQPAG